MGDLIPLAGVVENPDDVKITLGSQQGRNVGEAAEGYYKRRIFESLRYLTRYCKCIHFSPTGMAFHPLFPGSNQRSSEKLTFE